jgi:hypothetical protein
MGWQQIVVSGIIGVAGLFLARWALSMRGGSGGCHCDRARNESRTGLKQTPLVSIGVKREPGRDGENVRPQGSASGSKA